MNKKKSSEPNLMSIDYSQLEMRVLLLWVLWGSFKGKSKTEFTPMSTGRIPSKPTTSIKGIKP